MIFCNLRQPDDDNDDDDDVDNDTNDDDDNDDDDDYLQRFLAIFSDLWQIFGYLQ